MDIRLSAPQRDVADRLSELFDDELLDTLRRLGERPLGGGEAASDLDDAEAGAREGVWQVLCDLEIPRLTVPGAAGLERHASLVVVAETFGHALYGSPLLDIATAAEMITAAGGASSSLLDGIATGDVRLAVAAREHGRSSLRELPDLQISPDGRTCTAERRFVAFAADADMLLIAGRTPAGVQLVLVPRDQPGVVIRRQDDIARGDLYTVSLREAEIADGGWLGELDWPGAADAYAAALAGARLRQAAYLVGLAKGALAVTIAYTRSRQQFGQPVARFQAPAFRLAALYARIEAVGDLVQFGAWQADQEMEFATTANQALSLAGDLARDATVEAVQLHGAYGMTERCDAQRFYRRAAVDAVWCDSPTMLRAELAGQLVN